MKHFFTQDKIVTGLVAGLGSELLFCLLLAIGLLVLGYWPPTDAQIRWFGGMFIPLILIFRAYAKTKQHLIVTKTLIVIFFVTFIAFIFFLFSTHILVLK